MNKKTTTKQKKILVAMSGGVDSTVAALLLIEAGCEVIGVTMDTGYGHAPKQAAVVCRELGIVHHILDVRESFSARVVDSFVKAYLHGETPNPCVACNAELKFPVFMPLLTELGADAFATGHYVRIREQCGRFVLVCGSDQAKDQSYFLYQLKQEILSRCIFPLGGYTKPEVRGLAEAAGLTSASQKDSYDICFIPDGDYRALFKSISSQNISGGEVTDSTGRIVGRHNGLANYTIGQRRGLDISLGYPAYVLSIDTENNRLIVGPKDLLYATEAVTRQNNFFLFDTLVSPIKVQVRVRYRAQPKEALIEPLSPDLVRIRFHEPEWGITPGQSAVFYQDEILIGGGIITTSK